ncbi:hypothetical protein CFP56_039475 [Quercus suber]|uniref:Uncharacterized protein n=1 Tax=Quercus suber TaxID=58331 RepID=A0AAW0J0Q6_QUESU
MYTQVSLKLIPLSTAGFRRMFKGDLRANYAVVTQCLIVSFAINGDSNLQCAEGITVAAASKDSTLKILREILIKTAKHLVQYKIIDRTYPTNFNSLTNLSSARSKSVETDCTPSPEKNSCTTLFNSTELHPGTSPPPCLSSVSSNNSHLPISQPLRTSSIRSHSLLHESHPVHKFI